MDIYWWLDSVIIPLSCAIIGSIAVFFGCKSKINSNNKNIKKSKTGDISGTAVINSKDTEIHK